MFKSFIMGGFECSTHRNPHGRRVDVIDSTKHDKFARADYERLLRVGMKTARDGVRWHLIESEPFRYDFSSLSEQARAAEQTEIQIIWDFFHYGFPDDLDIFSEDFIERFVSFARATTIFLKSETNQKLLICPTNEISFFAWAAGEVGCFYPYAKNRGDELKKQLVKATITAVEAIRSVASDAVFIQADPVVRVSPDEKTEESIRQALDFHEAQFTALDMLCGSSENEFGKDYPAIIGLNYYVQNQWRHPSGERIYPNHADYVPFHKLLLDNYERYKKPILIAETGIEDEARPEWFRRICREVRLAQVAGAEILGICLYPIINHTAWDSERWCENGLWDAPDEHGNRLIYQPLVNEIEIQKEKFERQFQKLCERLIENETKEYLATDLRR